MERIGHYSIVSELGRGGMGVVYKAHEESLNRFVAIKVLGEHLETDDEYVQRFVREARSAAALSHPNIVQIYAISEDDGHHYFVMEYVPGTSVERMIHSRGKIEPVTAARLILQAAAGLQDAHAQGVIHRDIKPANLMVSERGLVKIADFGLALMGSAVTRLTATGMLMGTPGYLSPEQCLDQGPDHRTDIYSLGVTFFEMVTGTMPFRADSPLALLKQIVEVDPPDIRTLNPEVDEKLRNIIAQMLAKDREQRYADCGEVIAAIRGWLEDRGEPLQGHGDGDGTAAGILPPPPIASADDLNTQPTVAVASGETDRPAANTPPPPPPRPPMAAAVAATGSAPRATAPATQTPLTPRAGRVGLVVAAIVLFIVAVGAVATVLTLKSGLLDRVFSSREAAIAENEADPSPSEAVNETSEPTPVAESSNRIVTETGSARVDDDRTTSASTESGQPSAPGVGASSAVIGGTASTSEPAGSADRVPRAAGTAESTPVAAAPEQAMEAAPATGTVVIAFGERLLAAEAESYVKSRLERAGVEIIEVTSIPGFEDALDTEQRPNPDQFRNALRPHARYLVPLRIEYLGDRAIFYMGQRDIVYSARINIGLVDLESGRQVSRPRTVTVEYTQLNADEVVDRELRRIATGLVQQLPRE